MDDYTPNSIQYKSLHFHILLKLESLINFLCNFLDDTTIFNYFYPDIERTTLRYYIDYTFHTKCLVRKCYTN